MQKTLIAVKKNCQAQLVKKQRAKIKNYEVARLLYKLKPVWFILLLLKLVYQNSLILN